MSVGLRRNKSNSNLSGCLYYKTCFFFISKCLEMLTSGDDVARWGAINVTFSWTEATAAVRPSRERENDGWWPYNIKLYWHVRNKFRRRPLLAYSFFYYYSRRSRACPNGFHSHLWLSRQKKSFPVYFYLLCPVLLLLLLKSFSLNSTPPREDKAFTSSDSSPHQRSFRFVPPCSATSRAIRIRFFCCIIPGEAERWGWLEARDERC